MEIRAVHDKIVARLEDLSEKKARLVGYLTDKRDESDWHGVADAAMDLRDIESEKIGLEWILEVLQ